MILNHAALVNSSEKNAETFYKKILGMEKTKDFIVQRGLSHQVFDIDNELQVVVYECKNVRIEIFLIENMQLKKKPVSHLGFEIEDREELVRRALEQGAEVTKIPRENGYFLFIRDFDGNLFEIKPLA
jgi:catechol 2,3-dioxygenase-like lactoylglutathione lyase family enzyme